MARVLIADDELVYRSSLTGLLKAEGYDVVDVKNGAEAVKAFDSSFDLVVLDVMMPELNGFKACELIRAKSSSVPIVFVTGKDSEADEVRGLGFGADDYISKDAGDTLLLARFESVIRRSEARTKFVREEMSRIELGQVSVELDSGKVKLGKGKEEHLTSTELSMLKVLANRRGEPVSADELVNAIRGDGFVCEDSMIYSHLSNLRRKLGVGGEMIDNVRGFGYRLVK